MKSKASLSEDRVQAIPPLQKTRPIDISGGTCYAVATRGHRQHYTELLSRELGLEPVIAAPNLNVLRTLIGSRRTFFVTLDDDIKGFILVALARTLLGRPTIGLFLRPRECFDRSRARGWIKWMLFRSLNALPPIRMLTILPFWLETRFEQVARGWIYDPQFWDLGPGAERSSLPMTSLAESVLAEAAGRKIVVSFGQQTTEKGVLRIIDTWRHSEALRKKYLFVIAGIVPAANAEHAQGFAEQGGRLVPRFLSEEEMLSLYRVADYMWCCYAPNYDQASGVFGRAMQLGVPALVRQGSFLQVLAGRFDAGAIALPYDDGEAAGRILCDVAQCKREVPKPLHLLATMRTESLTRLRRALQLDDRTTGDTAI